jgi:hypothetical protein
MTSLVSGVFRERYHIYVKFRESVIAEDVFEPNSWLRNAHSVHAISTTEPLQIDQKVVPRLVLEVTVCVLCVRSVV